MIRELGVPTLVVGPKISKTAWERAGEETGTEFDYINWEMLRTGKTRFGGWYRIRKTPFHKPRIVFRFNSGIRFVVADEFHRAKARDSQNGDMMRAVHEQGLMGLGLTASPAASPLEMRALGLWMDFHGGSMSHFSDWCRSNGCSRPPWGGLEFTRNSARATKILSKLAFRMRDRTVSTKLRDIHPDHGLIVQATLLDLDEPAEAARLAEEVAVLYRELRNKELSAGMRNLALEAYLRARQAFEILKVPSTCAMIDDLMERGATVIVFCNFSATVNTFVSKYIKAGVITGETPQWRRQEIIDLVARDQMHLVIANQDAGGESVNFQDVTGVRQRVELIFPGTKASNTLQVLGRVDRLLSKSAPLARFLIAAGTREESVYKTIQKKAANICTLTDRDFAID